jgi:photosystem II stability/assembly factor-like uncharacterized protein
MIKRFLSFAVGAVCLGLVLVDAGFGQNAGAMPDLRWRMIGPFRGGRTKAAAGVPDQPNVFYVAQVNGGVWKTTDAGRTWVPVFDAEDTQSVGAIAVAPSDSNVVYVGSGEGLHRPDLSVGDGVYRSGDAGKTWIHLGLGDGEQIPALAIDPANPDRVFAAVMGHPYGPNVERGIFRSEDGGKTWAKVLYKDDRTGGSAVVIDPKNPRVVYAGLWQETLGPWEDKNAYPGTGGGLFKSIDGGTTWKQLKNGLPVDLVQINVSIAASNPKRIYAALSTTVETEYATDKGLGFYRSDDAGETWRRITDDPRAVMKIGGGDLPVIAADPLNADVVYSTGIVTTRSEDGGKTWTSLRGAPGGDDYQNIWINPRDSKILLVVSDQGAIVSLNRGETWSSWYNQPTAQLYHVAATNTFPYQVCAGQQESGSVCTSTRGNDGAITYREWHPAGVIEYGYAAPDPLHPEIVYGAGRKEVSRYDMVTGQVQNVTPVPGDAKGIHGDRTEPILFSPVDQHTMYYAANRLFKTTDYGHTWQTISPDLSREHSGQPASLPAMKQDDQDKRRGAIYAVAASYKTVQTIWAGTDDGLVWITRDAGAHWANITPPEISAWSKIAQIDASHFDDNTAYVAASRMRIDDMRPYAFKTHDGGKTWVSIGAGLPVDVPVNAVRADPVRAGLLYAATERAVWVSFDDGATWRGLEFNLPHTSMRDLLVHGDDLIVATHGRSLWVMDDVAPLREMVAGKMGMLLKPAQAMRVRRDNYTDTPLPPDEPMGENPPDGAVLDYALPADAQTVTLEIVDSKGAVLRIYSSETTEGPQIKQWQTPLIPAYWPLMKGPLAKTAGMHRWVWDLHATAPAATNYSFPISAVPGRTPLGPEGPVVLPGVYTVRLTVDGRSESQTLTVKMDPRVHTTATDLAALHAAQVRMAASLDGLAQADLAAHSVEEQMEASENAALKGELAGFDAAVKKLLEGEPAAKGKEAAPALDDVTGEVAELYGQLQQADNPPTAALLAACAHAREEGEEALRGWKGFVAKIAGIDAVLRKAGRPGIDLKRVPTNMPESGDEE